MSGSHRFLMHSLDSGGLCGHQISLALHRYLYSLKVCRCRYFKYKVLIDEMLFGNINILQILCRQLTSSIWEQNFA